MFVCVYVCKYVCMYVCISLCPSVCVPHVHCMVLWYLTQLKKAYHLKSSLVSEENPNHTLTRIQVHTHAGVILAGDTIALCVVV